MEEFLFQLPLLKTIFQCLLRMEEEENPAVQEWEEEEEGEE